MNYYNANTNVDREKRFLKAKKATSALLNSEDSKILDFPTYASCLSDDRVEKLIRFYDKVMPTWKTEFNELERKKKPKMRCELDLDEDLEDIIKSAQEDIIIGKAISIHVANKIAHYSQNTIKILVEKLLVEKNKDLMAKNDYEGVETISSIIDTRNSSEFNKIVANIRKYFDLNKSITRVGCTEENKKSIQKYMDNILKQLAKYQLDEKDLKTLEAWGVVDLREKENQAFYIKSHEISMFLANLKDRDDIDYGMATKITKSNNGRNNTEDILVVNLPYYGQFSVHLQSHKHKELLRNLGKDNYNVDEIYEKETVMLTEKISPKAREDLDKGGAISEEKLLKIAKTDFKYALYLAIKTGHEKEVIRKICSCSRENKKYGNTER